MTITSNVISHSTKPVSNSLTKKMFQHFLFKAGCSGILEQPRSFSLLHPINMQLDEYTKVFLRLNKRVHFEKHLLR